MNIKEVIYLYRGLKKISDQASNETDHGISCGMYKALSGVYDIIMGMCDPRNVIQEGEAKNGKED